MKGKGYRLLAGLTGLLVTWTASGAVTPAASQDLADIYQLAVKNDAQLLAQYQTLLATKELRAQARAVLLPSLDISANTSYNKTRDKLSSSFSSLFAGPKQKFNDHGYTLSLHQPLFNYSLFVGVKQARATVRKSLAEYTAAQQDLMMRVADRYFGVLAARDNLRFAQAETKAISRQLEQAQRRFDVGLIAITDIHEARARHDLAVAREIEANNGLRRSWELLTEITGQHHEALAALVAKIELATPNPADIAQWVSAALEQNASVQAQINGVEIASQGVQLQRAGHFPTVEGVVRQTYDSANSSRFGSPSRTEDTQYAIELKLPLFQGGLVRSRTRQAAHQHTQAKELLEGTQRAVVRQTRVAYLDTEASISSVKALTQALVSTRSALEATELGFKVGTRTSVDVLDSQRDLYSAERDLAAAKYRYILSTLRLKQAAGTLSPEDLRAVNDWLDKKVPVLHHTMAEATGGQVK